MDPRNPQFYLGDFLPRVQEKKAQTGGNPTTSTKSKDMMNITHYYTQNSNNLNQSMTNVDGKNQTFV